LSAQLERVRFGPDGPEVPRLGFGAIPIQAIPEAAAVDVVAYAFERGIRFFDTARAYTTSEERLARALRGVREQVFIVTKSAARNREELARDLECSLTNLGTDYLDLFLFHGINREDELCRVLEGPLDLLRERQREGQVRLIGLSSHASEVATRAVRSGEFAAVEFPFNYLELQCLEDLLPTARERGIPFIAMKPLAGGVLSSPEAAIKWLACRPVEVIIPGLRSREEVDRAVAAFLAAQQAGEQALTSEEREAIERDRAELDRRFCRRCGYCLPCPQDIPINFVLAVEQFCHRSGWARLDRRHLELVRKGLACDGCGTCETRCPFGLPLPEMVRPTAEVFLAEARRLRPDLTLPEEEAN